MNRAKWAKRWPDLCWVCGKPPGWLGLHTHHVERRSHGGKRGEIATNWLRCCDWCHEHILATLPHAEQLAIVKAVNPEEFDLEAWLRIRDPDLRAPNRVTLEEVDRFVEKYSQIGRTIKRILEREHNAA